jgi:type 1 fimbria pilin
MKKTSRLAVLAAALLPAVAMAESVDLNVIGTIIPTSCIPAFAGGGTVDLRKISASTLNSTTQTLLAGRDVSLHINCDAPAPVEVSVRDNRAGTKLPGISDGAGQSDPALFYGLGEINGVRIGGFALRHGIPETDGNTQTLLTRTLAVPAWRVPTSTLVSNAPQLYSWGTSAASGPVAARHHGFPMHLLPIIGPSNALPITSDIPLDGSVTFDMFYL